MQVRYDHAMLTLLATLLTTAPAHADVVWTGVDFSYARFIGTGDFNEPSEIFPGYLSKWNKMFVDEIVPDLVGSLKATVSVDNDGIFTVNAKANASQIDRKDGGQSLLDETIITTATIAEAVKGYPLKATSGTGLVLIVDRYVKLQEQGCTWIVWYDVGTRAVKSSTRSCEKASGFGFRNYWFHPLKELQADIKRTFPG